MGGCDKHNLTSVKELEQWKPSYDIPLHLLQRTTFWHKFNQTFNYELIRLDSLHKSVSWHVDQLINCMTFLEEEKDFVHKEKEKEDLETFLDIFNRRIQYLEKNEDSINYLLHKGFKISSRGLKLEEVNLQNIWAELYPLGYYFRSEEDEHESVLLMSESLLSHSLNSKDNLNYILERNLIFDEITKPLYNSLLTYYSIPLFYILERSVNLFHIHQQCTNLLSSLKTPKRINSNNDISRNENSSSISLSSHSSDYDSEDDENPSILLQSSDEISDDSSSISENDSSDNENERSMKNNNDALRTFKNNQRKSKVEKIFFTDKQIRLIEELSQHALNKSSYLLQIKRSIRMEHKRNFNLPGERKRTPIGSPHLSLLCLTNNLHIGESIDSLDPGNRCIYRKYYHIYKHSLDNDLHQLFPDDNDKTVHNNKRYHSLPPSPVQQENCPHVNHVYHHLNTSVSSPATLVSSSPTSSSWMRTSTSMYRHISFFIWLEGKDLEGVNKENFYKWDLIPPKYMKVHFLNGLAYHYMMPLHNSDLSDGSENLPSKSQVSDVDSDECINSSDDDDNNNINLVGNSKSNSKEDDDQLSLILNGTYIYAIDENDDLYVLPKVPEDEHERKWDLTALRIVEKAYPDYLLFPNHPRLIHSANGRSLGEITFFDGKITHISNVSGHYRPHGYQFYLAVIALTQKNGEIFNPDAVIKYRHSTGLDTFNYLEFIQLNRKEMLLDVIKGKDRPTGLLYNVKCNCD